MNHRTFYKAKKLSSERQRALLDSPGWNLDSGHATSKTKAKEPEAVMKKPASVRKKPAMSHK